MTLLAKKADPYAIAADPRCQPWAYIELDGRLFEVVRLEIAYAVRLGQRVPEAFLCVADCAADCWLDAALAVLERLPEADVLRSVLVRAAPVTA